MIDAAGPFQGADLCFARACIAAGVDYLDLADARDFVAAFPALDAEAKARQRPRHHRRELDAGDHARRARRADAQAGPASTRSAPASRPAIARRADVPSSKRSSAGPARRCACSSDGAVAHARRLERHAEARHPRQLGRRRFALAETPDLDLVPQRFAPREDAVFTAGLELGAAASRPRRDRLLRRIGPRPPRPLRALLRWLASLLQPFGSDRGAHVRRGVRARRRRSPDARGMDAGLAAGRRPIHADAARARAGAQTAGRRCASPPARGRVSASARSTICSRLRAPRSRDRHHARAPGGAVRTWRWARPSRAARRRPRAATGRGPSSRFDGHCRVDGREARSAFLPARLFGFPRNATRATVTRHQAARCAGARNLGTRRSAARVSAARSATPGPTA